MEIALTLENEEKNFIAACVRNERWAQRKLYEEYYSKMIGVCLRYSNNKEDARDILHEGFIKVFKNVSKYTPGTSLNAWIKRIMINTSIDFYRKNTRRRTEDLDNARHKEVGGADAISQMGKKEIMRAVQELSPAYRMVFNMYVVEGFSHREIANKMGVTESTSRSNLVKARTKLKQVLLPKYTEYGK